MRARGRTALREEMIRMRQTGASGEQSPMPGVSDITTPDSVTSIPLSDQHQQDNEEGVANLSGAFESKLRVSPTPSQEEGAEAARGDGTIDMGEELVGFGRIYCGTLRVGDKIWAMQPKYDPSQPECTKSHVKQVTISALYMLMGRELVLLDHVPAGNVFA
ncbi:Cytoplasmic GTPase/eEF2-like protein (ribosomal biogenesis), partial [Spiromyces aspiralis]